MAAHIQDAMRGIRQALGMRYSNDFKQKKSCDSIGKVTIFFDKFLVFLNKLPFRDSH